MYYFKKLFISICFLLSIQGCQNDNPENRPLTGKHYNTTPEDITSDYQTWYTYTYNNIKLGQDFVALDKDSVVIKKEDFLNLLVSGKYLPIKVFENNGVPGYKLFASSITNDNIVSTVSLIASNELVNHKMEGKELSEFELKDLKGNIYNNQNTSGKTVVLKCWFIRCVACVKEFPELNELVHKYRDNKQLLFISVATDPTKDLVKFLKNREFSYAVAGDQKEFIYNELQISTFPTHIIIGEDGKIKKVVNNYADLEIALEKEVGKAI